MQMDCADTVFKSDVAARTEDCAAFRIEAYPALPPVAACGRECESDAGCSFLGRVQTPGFESSSEPSRMDALDCRSVMLRRTVTWTDIPGACDFWAVFDSQRIDQRLIRVCCSQISCSQSVRIVALHVDQSTLEID